MTDQKGWVTFPASAVIETAVPADNIAWWRSDEAFEHRCGLYLAQMLWADLSNRRTEWRAWGSRPEWPAIIFYDAVTDQPFWVECKSPTYLRDFKRACQPTHMNDAALRLVESNDQTSRG